MKLTTKEFKELYEWAKSLEDTSLATAYVNGGLEVLKEVDQTLCTIEKVAPTKEELGSDFEKNLKEAIEKFSSFMDTCENMMESIKLFKDGVEELSEIDGKIAACVTEVKEIGELPKDPVIKEFENKLGNAIKNYENRMY